ncbi:MAG: SDR family NAD(P)-dependent oxidoreductase [Rhodobacterales bacterium]|nr:MAG: SDR family NAD(P)-dependent oxidoreductase [Rhodobacterales bacterium]
MPVSKPRFTTVLSQRSITTPKSGPEAPMSSPLARPTTVLLTGATSGIGAALLPRLLDRGNTVIALARRATHLPARAGLVPVAADLTDLAGLPALAARIAGDHPGLSVLINAAGVQHAIPLTDPASTPAHFVEETALNLTAPAVLVQALLPTLIRQPDGAIVNLSSGLATFPKAAGGLYSATKAGLSSFTTSLRWQLEATPLLVAEVILPLVDTPMTAGRGRGKISAEAAAVAILSGIDARRTMIRVGAARALPLISAFAPWLGRRILRGT